MTSLLFSQAALSAGGIDDWIAGERALAPCRQGIGVSYADTGNPSGFAFIQEAGIPEMGEGAPLAPDTQPGRTRYALTQVSDTGAVVERHGYLLVVAFCVPPESHAEVEAWYRDEHIGLLMRGPGWLRARRFHVQPPFQGPRWTSIALHELRDLTALESEERRLARSTAWRARLAVQPWFKSSGRWVYRRL